MDYYEFVHVVETELNNVLKEGVKANIYTATKNNNKKKTGVVIEAPGINISPTIYLEEFYGKYQKGKSIQEIVTEVITFYNQVKYDRSWEISNIEDYEKVKSRIILKLVNSWKNADILGNIPHKEYFDLSILFCVLLEKNVESTATMLIKREQMEYWGVDETELYERAVENVKQLLPPQLVPMEQLIQEMMSTERKTIDNLLETPDKLGNESMFVLTNSIRSMGAACIVYPGVLEKISSVFKSGFYVLPSSVHEVILIPDENDADLDRLSEMVREVNESQVEEEEILSDHAYYYNRVQGGLKMIFREEDTLQL